jgi:dolichol-phosphate mannosyltransferase
VADATTPPRVLVSTATYNERENLQPLFVDIAKFLPDADVLVIDDNSPDGTGKLADELSATDPRLHVIHRAGKHGLGSAILAGMRYAMDNGYDLFVNMDADFSHHPKYLPALIAGMRRNDVMIGSRYVPGGGTENWPLRRRFISMSINTLTRILMRLPARDTSGGYRCYNVAKLRQARLDRVISQGYSFQQEVLYRCRRAGCRIGETPIIFADRRAGVTKVNTREVVRSLSVILLIGLKAFFGQD